MREKRYIKIIGMGLGISMILMAFGASTIGKECDNTMEGLCYDSTCDKEIENCKEFSTESNVKLSGESVEKCIQQSGNGNICKNCGNTIIKIDNSYHLDSQCLCPSETSCDLTATKTTCETCDSSCSDHTCESCQAPSCSDSACKTCGNNDDSCANNNCAFENNGENKEDISVFEKCCDFLSRCSINLNCILEIIHNFVRALGLM
jgi:hypothetical protein